MKHEVAVTLQAIADHASKLPDSGCPFALALVLAEEGLHPWLRSYLQGLLAARCPGDTLLGEAYPALATLHVLAPDRQHPEIASAIAAKATFIRACGLENAAQSALRFMATLPSVIATAQAEASRPLH